jgi:hypothetical protein
MRRLLWGIGSVASAAGRVRLRPAWSRRVMVRVGLASVVVASLAVTALPAPARAKVSEPSGQPDDRALPAAAARGSGWSVTPSPNPVIPTGQLFWVSCPAAGSCMAVGTYVKPSGAGVNLAERWNGHSWRILPTPSPAGTAVSSLLGVACTAPSACTAVGSSITATGASQAVAEHWNGTRWRIQPTPKLSQGASLNGVSCTSASACTAVGRSGAGPLAERWNGARWSIQATPNPPQGNGFLSGVACTSATMCIAAGASNPFTPGAKTLAERWNGTRWTIQATPNPSQGGGGLNGVSCTSASACTAVGNSNAGNLAARWNGTSWKIQPAPNPGGAQFTFLNTVACASASACTAAGAYIDSSGAFQALAERWNGTSWAIQPTPGLAGGVMGQLIGVACTSATGCLAVGFSNPNLSNNPSPATLAERWNGSTWSVQRTPNPPGAAAGNLNAASCVSRSACIAVGNTSNSRGTSLTLAQRGNGHTWRIQATPSPADGGNLIGVSCPSRSSCLAVGGHSNPFTEIPPGTLAERWNGTTWRIQPTPNPPGGGWFLGAVSCTSPTACTAVGGRLAPPGKPTGTLAERWDGHTWSIQSTPNPPGHGVKLLNSVACTSRSSCMAVGNEFDPVTGESLGTLAERWNGRTWRIVPTFKPAPAGPNAGLNGVACTSASACTAVGNQTLARTLAERWNGRTWEVQATPKLAGAQNTTLASVACPARTVCTAFGLNLTVPGAPVTLAERWRDGRWRIQPTPSLVAYDIGFPGVACPTVSTCYTVASYTNNGPSLTLTERWNKTGASAQPATGRPVAVGALPTAGMAGSLPISGRIPAAAWSRFRSTASPAGQAHGRAWATGSLTGRAPG